MKKELYVVLIVIVIFLTIFALNPSLKNKISSIASIPTTGISPAADIYKTTVIVYQGAVQLTDFDKKGELKNPRLIKEGQSAVVRAKRMEETEEASRIIGLARLVFPNIIETFYQRATVWAQKMPPGQSTFQLSEVDINNGMNKHLARSVVSDIQVVLNPEGFDGSAILRVGVVHLGVSGKAVVSVDQGNGGRLIMRMRELKAGNLRLPDVFLKEVEKAFAEVFSRGLPVKFVSIVYQGKAMQITCVKIENA